MEQEKENLDQKESINGSVDSTEKAGNPSQEGNTPANSDVDKLAAELAEFKDKYLRLYADFENFRRRSAKEKMEFLKTASEDIITAILPILDDFERAQKSQAEATDAASVKEGMQLIYNKLFKILEQKGLKPMESVGKEFNSELHESIAQTPAPSDDLKGKVIDEVEKGYYLNDKVIRYAKTIVGA